MVKNNIYTSFYPHLDLHGETYDTCVAPLLEFINDNLRLKKSKVVIIHGRSGGILKSRVHDLLRQNRNVIEFQLDSWNLGETVVTLKIDK